MLRRLFIASAVALLAGCAVPVPQTRAEVAATAIRSADKYSKISSVRTAPLQATGIRAWGDEGFALFFLMKSQKESVTSEEIRVLFSGQRWRFFTSAVDSNGRQLTVSNINRHVGSDAWVNEEVSISLPPGYLQNQEKGLDIKLYGSGGSAILQAPAYYVQGFLDAAK